MTVVAVGVVVAFAMIGVLVMLSSSEAGHPPPRRFLCFITSVCIIIFMTSLTASTAIENEQDFDKVDLVFGVSPVDSMTIRDVPVEHYTTTADGVSVAD